MESEYLGFDNLFFSPIGSLLLHSPELQALLMNQLTVKVRVRGGVNAPLYAHFWSDFLTLLNSSCLIVVFMIYFHHRAWRSSASPLSRLTPVSRSWWSATCRGIFSLLLLITSPSPGTWDLSVQISPSLSLWLQWLWGSVVSPERGERHVPVEAEVRAPRSGFSSYRRYSAGNPALLIKHQILNHQHQHVCFMFSGAITAVGSFSLKANELLQWVIIFFDN